ncbi:MAG TPA: UvrD-helicase domain-containing protein [Thermoleophilaceae bacterium]
MKLTAEQQRAIDRRDGGLLVRAGAGTGKTTVLVERFVRAVVDDGVAVDSILAITFTEKAAAEMKGRVRRRFVDLDRREEARQAEAAWISTIHGFCSRVLRTHALAAGIDPEYHVLDELEAERLGLEAFDAALEAFLPEDAPSERVELVAAYTPDKLRDMTRTTYSRLRSRGESRPELPVADPPAPRDERERLDAAAAAGLRVLAGVEGVTVAKAVAALEACQGLAPGAVVEPGGLEALELKRGRVKALAIPECDDYEEALAAYAALCKAHGAWRDQAMLRELLSLYGDRYAERKLARSALDFEDLELLTRDLLASQPGLRAQYRERFSHVLVDEFQDTNRLQNQLLELLDDDTLFRVGDENQSIYGFRHADVEVFREHWRQAEEAGRTESLTTNFRSRGEVLDAIDMAFGRLWEGDFDPLKEAEGSRGRAPAVELFVTDKSKQRWEQALGDEPFGDAMRPAALWRAAEARLLAKRVRELLEVGRWERRDVVLLFRATTHMVVYERALEERGVSTYVVGGRGYWSQQQVGDLRHWLSALANPLDELAVYSILASPLVGLSLDAVALLGVAARRTGRDPWWLATEPDEELAGALPDEDRRRLDRFVAIFADERRAAPRLSLETLIDRAVTVTGYDRRVLALPAGDRRMANVRKLMRMAREYEADEGRDLRGFIDFVAERDLIQEREGEAPLEAEQLDAVRLMTVHRAKGLEFPVVCVADLGKDGKEDYGSLRVSDDGRTGIRLAQIGGGSVKSDELERIEEEDRLAAEAEERRIFYVAVTRAEDHLVLSGATDLDKRPEPKPLSEPMRWVWRSFCRELPDEGASGVATDEYEGREVQVRWTRLVPDTADELLGEADRAPVRAPSEVSANGSAQPELMELPPPRALPVSRLSYSGLEAYKRCSYRFYLEKGLKLSARELEPDARDLAGPPEAVIEGEEPRAGDELPALLRGTIVHELLEGLDFSRPRPPGAAEVTAAIERHGAVVEGSDVDDIEGLVAGFVGTPLAERIARSGRARAELPFAFTLKPPDAGGRSLLVNGVVDVHSEEDGGTLIVDYKSDRLEGADPVAYCEDRYSVQRLVYALAALRSGAERVEVAYVFLERPDAPVVSLFEAGDADRLERELLELARGVVEGRFVPTDEPHLELCRDCPARPALCTWDEKRTLAPRAPC